MKKSSWVLSVLLAVFIANQNYGANIPSLTAEDQVYGQNFLNIKPGDKSDTSLKTDFPNTGTFLDNNSRTQDDINIGVLPDYILKPQDEVNIDIWGSLNLHYVLTVSSDGYIIIPEAGRVALNGLTYSEAKKKILNHLAYTYAFFINSENPGAGKAQVDITMGKTAGINVFVTGEVRNPGDLNINGINASIINILKKAGINNQASIRNIQLKKLNGKIYNFDVYDFLLKGNLPPEYKYLNDGDIIFVSLRGKELSIKGSVRRQGLYELLPAEKLNDAIKIAGGVLPGSRKEIKIFRKTYNVLNETASEINTTIESDCVLEDKDVVVINGPGEADRKPLEDKDAAIIPVTGDTAGKYYVTVDGEVKCPGNYIYIKDEKVNDLIKRCGGLNSGAFLEGAEFYRNGAIAVVDFRKAFNEQDSKFNFVLMPGDKIIIRKTDPFVTVRGAVLSPSSIFFEEGESIDYYIKQAGGYKDNADKDNATIIASGGAARKAYSGFWSPNPSVPSGAIIDVPVKTNFPPASLDGQAKTNPSPASSGAAAEVPVKTN